MIETSLHLAVLLLAPCLYLATGWVLDAVRSPGEAPEPATVPLRGIVFWGVVGLLHVMSGGSRVGIEVAAVAGLAVLAVIRRTALADTLAAWADCRRTWWAGYLFFVVVLTLAPFPGMWLMGGDWLTHLSMATAVHDGTFGALAGHLSRCPLFGAAAMPLLDANSPLGTFQAFNAAAAISSWLPIVQRTLAGADGHRRVRQIAWAALALSPVVTVVVTNLWPKFFAGGCLAVALYRAADWRLHGRPAEIVRSGLWLGFAVFAHESSVLYVPLWLAIAGRPAAGARPVPWKHAAGALALGGAIVCIWQVWTVWRFGWAARIAANPVVEFAPDLPLWHKALLNLDGVLWGAIPGDVWHFWRTATVGVPEKSYYTLVCGVSTLGATAVGIGGLWVAGLGRAWRRVARERLRGAGWVFGGIAATVGCYALLLGTTSGIRVGTVQGGLVQLVMWLAGGALGLITREHLPGVRRVLAGWLLIGWLPYCAAAGAAGVIVNWSGYFGARAERFAQRDSDLLTVLHHRLEPLGMNRALWLVAVLAAGTIALRAARCWWATRANADRPSGGEETGRTAVRP